MQISITGKLGSGKSTVCKMIRDRYDYEIFSTGAIQREVAREMGISTLELNKRMKQDHSLDTRIDEATTRLSRERRDCRLIFDSRMAWHFAEDTFKIFLTVDPTVAAQRVMANPRDSEERYRSVEEERDKLVEKHSAPLRLLERNLQTQGVVAEVLFSRGIYPELRMNPATPALPVHCFRQKILRRQEEREKCGKEKEPLFHAKPFLLGRWK